MLHRPFAAWFLLGGCSLLLLGWDARDAWATCGHYVKIVTEQSENEPPSETAPTPPAPPCKTSDCSEHETPRPAPARSPQIAPRDLFVVGAIPTPLDAASVRRWLPGEPRPFVASAPAIFHPPRS